MTKSSDVLLSLNRIMLNVFKNINGEICVCYNDCDVKDGNFLKSPFGVGSDFESACDDYLSKIRGKILVFGAYSSNRREIVVLG